MKIIFTIAVFVAAGFMLFGRLSEASLMGDGARYGEMAKEMAQTGNYLSLQYGYEFDFTDAKPPMFFWINALIGKQLGFNNFSMKLQSAVFGYIGLLALFFFVRRYFNFYTAVVSVIVLVFTHQYVIHARDCVTDMTYGLFFELAVMSFWAARAENKNGFYYLMGAFTGLALMTRNLLAFMIYIVIFSYIFVSREFEIFKRKEFYLGIILSLVIAVPWHLAVYAEHGQMFLNQYYGLLTKYGFTATANRPPWNELFRIIYENYWPWLPFLLAGLYWNFKNYFKLDVPERKKILFVLAWAVIPFAFFHLFKVKHTNYIFPVYYALAIIIAGVFDRFSENKKAVSMKILSGMLFVVSILCIVFPLFPKTTDSREFADTIKMIPEIRSMQGDIVANSGNSFWHYSNCFWFYGDKRTVGKNMDEIITMLSNEIVNVNVVLRTEDYNFLISKLSGENLKDIEVIKTTKESVLLTKKAKSV